MIVELVMQKGIVTFINALRALVHLVIIVTNLKFINTSEA